MPDQSEPVVLGLWYDDLKLGEERYSLGRTITESDMMTFAGLTGDFGQIHTDEEFCKKTEFGTRIVHGLLGLAIAQGLLARTNYTEGTTVASLAWKDWTFKRPIFIGDTVRVRWRLIDKRESGSKPGMGIVTELVELMNQRGEVVQHGEHVAMRRRRPNAG